MIGVPRLLLQGLLCGVFAVWMLGVPIKAYGRDVETSCPQPQGDLRSQIQHVEVLPPIERLQQLRTLSACQPEQANLDAMLELSNAMHAAQKKLLFFKDDQGRTLEATAIFACSQLSQKVICAGPFADDTTHLGETESVKDVGVLPAFVKLEMLPGSPLKFIQAYSLEDSKAHETGQAAAATPLPLEAERLNLRPAIARGDHIVFVLVKETVDNSFLKFVWLFKERENPQPGKEIKR